MTLQKDTQLPLFYKTTVKRDVRTQFAALCFRIVKDKPQVLLVTSRGTRRWIVPKGWPIEGKTPAASAAVEAYEEAGVSGKAYDTCLGVFTYNKSVSRGEELPVLAMVFPLKVRHAEQSFPEAGERRRKWFSLKKAAARIAEPELRQIILTFDPRRLKH